MFAYMEAQVKLPLAALVQTFLIAPIAHSTVASWQRQDQMVATNWAVNSDNITKGLEHHHGNRVAGL